MTEYKLMGINDDTDECAKCGKTGLKKVMWISEAAEGEAITEPNPYGTTCGARLLGLRLRSKAKIERKVYEMLIEQLNEKSSAIMQSFEVFSGKFLLPADLCQEIRRNKMTVADAQRIRVERFPILAWNNTERSFANAEKFSKFL